MPESRFLDLVTGLRYHVLEWGGDDPAIDHTVVLIHGFLDLAWGWEGVVEAGLAGKFHIVAPDMRGHGDSDRVGPGGYYHFPDYLADLDDVIAKLGRDRVSIVGHSMGGSIAGYYAGTFPDKVHRLALLEGIGPPENETPLPDRVAGWISGWRRARQEKPHTYESIDEAAERLVRRDPRLGRDLAQRLAAHGTRQLASGRFQFKHDPLHLTFGPTPFRVDMARAFWERIACPVLLVDGAESDFRFSPDETARRIACFRHREQKTLLGAAHMMHRHQPAALAQLLADFLAR